MSGGFGQVVLGVVANAAVHGGERGTVELRLVEGMLGRQVMEAGPGLPAQTLTTP